MTPADVATTFHRLEGWSIQGNPAVCVDPPCAVVTFTRAGRSSPRYLEVGVVDGRMVCRLLSPGDPIVRQVRAAQPVLASLPERPAMARRFSVVGPDDGPGAA